MEKPNGWKIVWSFNIGSYIQRQRLIWLPHFLPTAVPKLKATFITFTNRATGEFRPNIYPTQIPFGVASGRAKPHQIKNTALIALAPPGDERSIMSSVPVDVRRVFNNRSYIKSCRWGTLEEQNKLQDVKFEIRVNEQDYVSSLQYKRSVVTTGYSVSNTFILNKILWLICCDTCANSNCADTVNLSFPLSPVIFELLSRCGHHYTYSSSPALYGSSLLWRRNCIEKSHH